MDDVVTDAVVDLLTIALTAIGSGTLTVLGLLAEHAGVQNVLAGHATVGLWEIGMGALALFAGLYLLGYQKVWLRFRGRRLRS